jgi:hypothetical protein
MWDVKKRHVRGALERAQVHLGHCGYGLIVSSTGVETSPPGGSLMPLIDRIRERSGKTELLIHLSDRAFLRMAGHLDENERQQVGQRAAIAKLKELDAVIASPLWRRIWEDKEQPTEARIEKIAAQKIAAL